MARNCYVFAFLTLCTVLCVSALEEGATSLEKKDIKALGVDQILRLPSQRDARSQAIPWEQSPIEIHSFRVPRRPMFGEAEEVEMEDHPNIQQGRSRPIRFRFGRPGGCHGKFKHFLMPREDPFRSQFSRRMGMGEHRHVHAQPFLFPAIEDVRGDEKASSRNFPADLKPQRGAMGFEKPTERESEGGFVESGDEERGALSVAWLRSIFN